MNFEKIITLALQKNASDILLSVGSKPCLKINGEVRYIEEENNIDIKGLEDIAHKIMNEAQKKLFLANKEIDFAIEIASLGRLRVNIFLSKNGLGMVLRIITKTLPDITTLGLPETLFKLSEKKNGLLLVTGSVGSGKSTTLASLIDSINNNTSKHIITIEDPIEFVFQNKKSLIEQREVGNSTLSFENGLKYALRQASDVIMIGEMRDLETFRLALRAAETGNLVIATLHTSGASRTISRIVDMFPGDEKDQIKAQLSESLIGIIWQDLIKNKEGKGRVLACELLVNNSNVSNMIRRGLFHQLDSAIETGREDGMFTMNMSLKQLQEKGEI